MAHTMIAARITFDAAGQPITAPIESPEEAISALAYMYETIGYSEGRGDLWLGSTLDRVIKYLEATMAPRVSPTCSECDYCDGHGGFFVCGNGHDEPVTATA